MQLDQYQDLKEIYNSERNRIYQGIESSTGKAIILKVSSSHLAAGLYNEVEIAKGLNDGYSLVEIDRLDGVPTMVRDYVEGEALIKLIDKKGMPLALFFSTAFALIEAVEKLHNSNILHLDISPSNLIINTENHEIQLIDFEQSAHLDSLEFTVSSLYELEGDLRYIAPERTGRMNRRVEYRSDYYSLGSIFYEMLSGGPPFDDTDPLILVHSHLAKLPDFISSKRRDIPETLSRIIQKLLAKNAEDRYQSLIGLRTDLYRCKEEWEQSGKVSDFSLGMADRIGKLNISQKLYGREKELEELKGAFNLAAKGNKVLCLLAGFSGVGKSVLAGELYRPVSAKQGMFLRGKFDAIQRSAPFYAWAQAFDQFIEWLLVEPEEVLYYWRDKILRQISGLGEVLIDLVPRFRLIIGKQPKLVSLPAKENQQRIQFAINAFISALVEAEYPVVFFLDDWQWADEASIQLLESLFANDQLEHLMLIAAYRDNEVNKEDSFSGVTQQIQENLQKGIVSNGYLLKQKLLPLSLDNITNLLTDTLHLDKKEVLPLAEILKAKTHGNAFAITNLLQVLYEEQFLVYQLDKNRWTWNAQKILEKNISPNVAEWLVSKLRRLPPETIRILQIASASGAEFRLSEIAYVCGMPQSETHRWLWRSIRDGFVEPEHSQYKFLPDYYEENNIDLSFSFIHDRVQQAVYQTIPSQDREQFHFEIGQLLLSLLEKGEERATIFDVAQHFANGSSHLEGSGLEIKVGALLLETGKRAFQTATFDVAYSYLQKGMALKDFQIEDHQELLAVYAMLIEAAFMLDHEEEVEKLVQESLALCRTPQERIIIEEGWIRCLISSSKFEQTKQIARDSLARLGVKIPAKTNKIQVILNALKTGSLLPVKKMDQIVDFPLMTDPEKLAAMRILAIAAPAFHFTDVNTYALVIMSMVKLSIQYGNCPESIQGYSSYGIILTAAVNKPKEGYLIGKQSLRLLDKLDASYMEPIARFVDGAFISHLQEPISASLSTLRKGYQSALKNGNLDYATWCLFFINFNHYYQGYPIPDLLENINKTLQLKRQYRQFNQLDKSSPMREYAMRMIDLDKNPAVWKNDQFDEQEILQRVETTNDNISALRLYTEKAITFLWYEDYDASWKVFTQGDKILESSAGTLSIPHHLLYQSLAGIRSGFYGVRKVQKKIASNRKRLLQMQKNNPINNRYAVTLIDAELAAAKKAPGTRKRYDKAIETATQDGFTAAAAYGQRCLGIYLKEIGDPDAQEALEKACTSLSELGMDAIEKLTRNAYLPRPHSVIQSGKHLGMQLGMSMYDLDAKTLIKTTQALTSEIKLDRLIEKLMLYALENAGAQKGWFILRRENQWVVELGMQASDSVGVFQKTPLGGCGLLAETVVNYAAQTKQPVVIDDASATYPFLEDPFVLECQAKSILCIPFVHQSKIAGFIYLANDLTSGAFTKDRVEFLNLLTSQLGVNIENAMLYEQMEGLVEIRTRQLKEEKEKADQLLLNILPEEVAEELKQKGEAKARRFDSVSVLFADIKDFSQLAERISAEELVEELHYCFSAFDEIVEKYNVEKIKTIGDAYLCASGLPLMDEQHASKLVQAALEMQSWVAAESAKRRKVGKSYFQARIGIHSGPVVAGIVGTRKFAYDIWGDTVNVAARMEETSEAGRINVSQSTYDFIKDDFEWIFRGELKIKNRGEMNMYFVK